MSWAIIRTARKGARRCNAIMYKIYKVNGIRDAVDYLNDGTNSKSAIFRQLIYLFGQ